MARRLILLTAVVAALGSASASAATSTPVFAGSEAGALPATNSQDFGKVKPSTIAFGKHIAFCRIHWLGWGNKLAVGTGTGFAVNPKTYRRHPAPVVIVLSNLGTWRGHPAYKTYTFLDPPVRRGYLSAKPCKTLRRPRRTAR